MAAVLPGDEAWAVDGGTSKPNDGRVLNDIWKYPSITSQINVSGLPDNRNHFILGGTNTPPVFNIWDYISGYFVASYSTIRHASRSLQCFVSFQAFDAVFFHGATLNGTYLCAGGERRRNGVVNGLFYLLHPEFGMLKSPKLPNTKLVMDPEAAKEGKKWSAEGITFTPVEPMRRWNISYNGKMRSHESPETVFEVVIQATFTSTLPWVSFDVDLPAKTMARAIAREPWSRKKFELMKEAHQSHYEQMGDIVGTIKVNGKELPLKMDGFRDHSFGFKRDWTLMHRYIFHMFYLENQTRITLGVISQPCTASQVEMGYVVFPNGKLEMIESCDLQLWQHGESGRPSDQISFSFNTKSNIFECMVTYNKTASHFVGGNEVVKMYERFADCNVNGVKGKSISEWCYNNVSGSFDLNHYKC